MTPQDFGTYVEYLLAIKCIEEGYAVSFPLQTHSAYDCIIDTGERIVKVQIKGTRQKKGKKGDVKLNIADRNAQKYHRQDVDFFAVYASAFEGFFIFPYKDQKSIRLGNKKTMAKYFNNFAFEFCS